jgi:hypothetical protein
MPEQGRDFILCFNFADGYIYFPMPAPERDWERWSARWTGLRTIKTGSVSRFQGNFRRSPNLSEFLQGRVALGGRAVAKCFQQAAQ